jgi:hypothetical protein
VGVRPGGAAESGNVTRSDAHAARVQFAADSAAFVTCGAAFPLRVTLAARGPRPDAQAAYAGVVKVSQAAGRPVRRPRRNHVACSRGEPWPSGAS